MTPQEKLAITRLLAQLPPELAAPGLRAIEELAHTPAEDFFAGQLALTVALGLKAQVLVEGSEALDKARMAFEASHCIAVEMKQPARVASLFTRLLRFTGKPEAWTIIGTLVLSGVCCFAVFGTRWSTHSGVDDVLAAKSSILWVTNDVRDRKLREALVRKSQEGTSVGITCLVGSDQDNLDSILMKDSLQGTRLIVSHSIESFKDLPELLVIDYGEPSQKLLIENTDGSFGAHENQAQVNVLSHLVEILARVKE